MPRAGASKYLDRKWIGFKSGKMEVIGVKERVFGDRVRYAFIVRCACGKTSERCATQFIKDAPLSCVACRGVRSRKPGFSLSFLNSYKIRAEQKGRDYELTPDLLESLLQSQSGRCALSGEPLSLPLYTSGIPDSHFNVSIDRIDASKGYTPDNIQLVQKKINTAKNAMSDAEFIDMCGKVVKWQKRKTTLH